MVLHVIGFRCTMMPEPLSRHLCMHGLSTKFGKIPEICKQYPQNITNTTEDATFNVFGLCVMLALVLALALSCQINPHKVCQYEKIVITLQRRIVSV